MCIGELLRDPSRSLLHIFGDPGQNLYEREMEPPFREPAITLPANCRNTKTIAEWIAANTNIATTASEWSPAGEEPECLHVQTEHEEVDAVRKLLHRLVYNEKIEPGRIAILGPHALGNCSLGAYRILGPYYVAEAFSPYKIPAIDESGNFDIPPDKIRIRYSTIHSFKGLEADIVILLEPGVSGGVHGDEKTLTYVGASRARHRLFVIRRR